MEKLFQLKVVGFNHRWCVPHLIQQLVSDLTLLFYLSAIDIEAQILEIQGMKATLVENGDQGVGMDSTGYYDQEIYGGSDSRFAGYVTSIAANEQEDVSIFEYIWFM